MFAFDAFDRIRIINLQSRKDRRDEMNHQLSKVGLLGDPRVSYFFALSPKDAGMFYSPGAHGCFLSHREVIVQAAEAGQSLLILEDDCNFTDSVKEPLPPFDFLWGGLISASDPDDLENSDLIGAHFIGMNRDTVQKCAWYLSRYLDPDFPADPRASAEPGYDPAVRPVSDGAYVWFRRAHPEVKTVFADLGVQRPSRTDVGATKWFDRIPLIRAAAEKARRMRAG